MKLDELKTLVEAMYWDYDRLSSSGQETLNQIANLIIEMMNDSEE